MEIIINKIRKDYAVDKVYNNSQFYVITLIMSLT